MGNGGNYNKKKQLEPFVCKDFSCFCFLLCSLFKELLVPY